MNIIKKVWYWLKYSSTNAEKISMTFKGIATLVVPIILYVANVYKLNLDSATATTVVDGVSASIIVIGGGIGGVITVIGALRKIWTSANGTNEVIAGFRN
jgi:hypothetical protein